MLIAMLQILAAWFWLWIVFYGWGSLVERGCRVTRDDAIAVLISPWTGIAGVLAFLQLWHFLVPVGWAAFGVVSSVGVVAALVFGWERLKLAVQVMGRHPRLAATGAALVIWLANRSLNTQEYNDHGLYYLNAIRWATDYAIVPGLVNVHSRLAFNNSNFLLHALLEVGGWRGYSAHLVNGFLAALCMPILLQAMWKIAGPASRQRALAWFVVALGVLVAMGATDRRISSANPDFAAVLLITVAAWRAMAAGLIAEERDGRLLRYNLFVFAILSAAAITIKTSVIFFATVAWMAILFWLVVELRRGRVVKSGLFWTLATMTICAATLIGPWIARGYVLSGCPLFPSTVGRAPVDWAVSTKYAAGLRETIYAYGRTTHRNREAGRQGFAWFKPWLIQVAILRAPIEIVAPAGVSLLCVVALVAQRRTASENWSVDSLVLPALFVAGYLVAIVLWFVTVPSPRMGAFSWWGLAGSLLAISAARKSGPLEAFRKPPVAALVVLFFSPMIIEAALIETRYRTNPNLPEYGEHFYQLQPFVIPTWPGRFPPVPKPALQTKSTASGLMVYMDEKDVSVWDSPLPAVVEFEPRLMLRSPGSMQRGFKLAPLDRADLNERQ
jgi:hypothetical protein